MQYLMRYSRFVKICTFFLCHTIMQIHKKSFLKKVVIQTIEVCCMFKTENKGVFMMI